MMVAFASCHHSSRGHIMQKMILSAMTALAFVSAGTAQAAQDAGLMIHNSRDTAMQRSVGGQVSVSLKFGDRQVVSGEDRLRLNMNAGPVFVRSDGHRVASNVIAASLAPSYKAELSIAGRPVVRQYTALGLKEAEARGLDGQQLGFSGGGRNWLYWVLGLGVVVGLGFLIFDNGSSSSSSSP